MRNIEPKTMDDVREVAEYAVKNGIKFDFYPANHESKTWCVAHTNPWIYADMTPTDMWHEINRSLKDNGINLQEKNFNNLKSLVTALEKNING